MKRACNFELHDKIIHDDIVINVYIVCFIVDFIIQNFTSDAFIPTHLLPTLNIGYFNNVIY